MGDIIQLKITLKDTEPAIWREILVDKSTTFSTLHVIIQIVMGWDSSHLYEFNINGSRVGEPHQDDQMWGLKMEDASLKSLGSLISRSKLKFSYLYDFGDSWEHVIQVEKILPKEENVKYPVCIDGALNCPPDDCGGVGGFYDLLNILKNKKHPEYKEMLEWMGGKYDPEAFNKGLVNRLLQKISK